MNILFFVESGLGNSAMLADQLHAIYKQNPNIIAVLSDKDQELGITDNINKVGIKHFILSGLLNHKNFRKEANVLSKIIKDNDIEIVHTQTNWELALTIYAKYFVNNVSKFKIVYTIHAYRNTHRIKSYIARLLLIITLFCFSDRVICTCTSLMKKFKLLSSKIILLPLGVNNSFFYDDYVVKDTSKLVLVYPAQFRKGKNQDMIIQAFAKYLHLSNDKLSQLILPGSGEFLEKNKMLCKKMGCEKQVIFPGQCSKKEILSLYKESNVAVIASSNETFGQCIVEPFVLGMNILTTNVGVASDIIAENVNGFYFETIDDLSRILFYISENKYLINSIGLNNFNKRKVFSWDNIVQKYLKELSTIIKSNPLSDLQ